MNVCKPMAALADPTRQRIVAMLAAGALSSGDIASRFELTAPAVSQHLKTLREARLVRVRPEKQKRIYELNQDGITELAKYRHLKSKGRVLPEVLLLTMPSIAYFPDNMKRLWS